MSKILKRTIVILFISLMIITVTTKVFSVEKLKPTLDEADHQRWEVRDDNGVLKNLNDADKDKDFTVKGFVSEDGGVKFYNNPEDKQKNQVTWGILAQPNIYCVEHGVSFKKSNMRVSAQYDVKNPILAYILAQTPECRDMYDNYDAKYYNTAQAYNPIQQALWKFLYLCKDASEKKQTNNSLFVLTNDEYKLIENTKNIKDPEDEEYDGNFVDGDKSKGLYYDYKNEKGLTKSGREIFNEALQYANQYYNVNGTPIVNLVIDENQLKITVEWNDEFRIKINDNLSNEVYNQERKNTTTIYKNLSDIKGNTITVEVTPIFTTYKASFRILKGNDYYDSDKVAQRIIAVTYVGTASEMRGVVTKELKTASYKVSLEKYISAVNGVSTQGRSGKAEYLTEQYEDKTEYDTQWTQHNTYKQDHVVTVKNGDYVTYTIVVRNDGEDPIYISEIEDTLPKGISGYIEGGYNSSDSYKEPTEKITIKRTGSTLLKKGESTSVMITVKVSASNLSTEIFKNTAKITKIQEEDGNELLNADEYDSTPFNNQDSDYFKMADIAIAGMVWQDDALNKQQDNYNGVYDNYTDKDGNKITEKKISGIKVELYRDDGKEVKLVATTYTDKNGNYKFTADSKLSPNSNETLGAIKLPNVSYYVVFEYDGITYTSTRYAPVMSQKDQPLTSNAREKEDNQKSFDGIVSNGRTEFNKKFETINNNSGISYETKNEDGYIPQSLHLFNDNMIMQSSTERITISNETQLQHINLGLRGRESFDLEIATDVYATKVTVNGVEGAYQYNRNTVTIRKADINVAEDAANVPNETRTTSVEQVTQDVRKSDIQNTSNTGLAIEVTYKITVKNASATDGLASLITDYFDSRYSLKKVYYSNENNTLQTTEGTSGEGYKSVTITLPEVYLTQGNTIDIYVVLNLDNASGILKELVKDGVQDNIPTFNLAEIAEYKTRVAEGQSEFTRGLIDIDSAPGSANREEARLTTNQGENTPTVNGNPTTVGYYFKAAKEYMNDRSNTSINDLKLEDDTCDAPILYFASADNERKITGTVFKDNTRLTEDNVKTGNGKFDAGEVGVYGVTVELVENGVVKQRTTTNKDGYYELTGFLPGNYQIRYRYGNEKETVLLHQYEEGGVNQESFNGADYQSTNNTGTYDAAKLNDTPNYWYLYNERDGGISTATDNTTRRETVNQNSGNFTSEGNALWNKIRAGSEVTESEVNEFIDKTKMDAATPQFHISVESTYLDAGGRRIERAEFGEYRVTKMNFGLAGLPMTSMKLQKNVKDLTIIDSTGTNVIAKITRKEDGNWSVEAGNIIATEGENPIIDVQVEDNKLQGAKLRVQYGFTSEVTQEKNFRDDVSSTPVRITGLVDFIDNDLLYNPDLDNNNQYWEIINHADIQFDGQSDTTDKLGTVDPDGVFYNTVVKAKSDNPLLLNSNSNTATITLEKQLSSVDSTFEDIATSNVDIYVYDNIVEITGLSAKKIETSNGIIIPGVQNDTARAEQITIHPPTGDSSIPTMYYIIGAISFVILAGGAFGIKKFVLTK